MEHCPGRRAAAIVDHCLREHRVILMTAGTRNRTIRWMPPLVVTADEVPGFVYGIVIAETILFFSFGLNQWLQYRGVGRWADYLFGEKSYLVLSLVAKSLLAWQIFGGSLGTDT